MGLEAVEVGLAVVAQRDSHNDLCKVANVIERDVGVIPANETGGS